MNIFRIFVLAVLSIIFVAAGSVLILSTGIEKTVLQTSFYKGVIEETDISSVIMEETLTGLRQQMSGNLEQLPEEQRQEVVDAVESSFSSAFNEEWIEDTALVVVDDGLGYLKGEQEQLNAVIDLSDRKAIIRQELEKEMESSLEVPAHLEERMTPQMRQELEAQKSSMVQQMMGNFPDSIAVAELLESHPDSERIKAGVEVFQWVYDNFKPVFYTILIVFAVVILLVAGLNSGLKWIGVSMMISGVLASAALFGLEQYLSSLLAAADEGFPAERLGPALSPVFDKINIFATIYALVGVVILSARFLMNKYRGI